jgi:hypothetical protein
VVHGNKADGWTQRPPPKGNLAAIDGLPRHDATGQDHLVTKVYSEVFTQYAVLRPAEVTAPDAPVVKVKVAKSAEGVTLPGFSFTQDGTF